MTDAEYRQQVKRLRKLSKKWSRPLGLHEWTRVNLLYDRAITTPGDDGWTTYAATLTKWQYKHAQIAFNMPAAAEMDDKELEEAFLHECGHILVNECRETEGSDKHEDAVVTNLAQVFRRIREAGEKEGRKVAKGESK